MDHPEKRTDAEPTHLCLENIKELASYKKKHSLIQVQKRRVN